MITANSNIHTYNEDIQKKKEKYQRTYTLLRDEYIANLFVDGRRVAFSENIFMEFSYNEKNEHIHTARANDFGYFRRCYDAFWYALLRVPTEVEAKHVIEINRIAMGAQTSLTRIPREKDNNEVINVVVSYPVRYGNTTLEGFFEQLKLWKASFEVSMKSHLSEPDPEKGYCAPYFYHPEFASLKQPETAKEKEDFVKQIAEMLSPQRKDHISWIAPWVTKQDDKHFEIHIEKILKEYHNAVKHLKERKEILFAICDAIKRLEQLHPFMNGNCRTICMILLNKLLIERAFGPALQNDPNKFDGHSSRELVIEIENSLKKAEYFNSVIQDAANNALKTIYSLDYYYNREVMKEPGVYSIADIELDGVQIIEPLKKSNITYSIHQIEEWLEYDKLIKK